MKLYLQPSRESTTNHFELTMQGDFDLNSISKYLPEDFLSNHTPEQKYGIWGLTKESDFDKLIIGYDMIFCGNNQLRKFGKICLKLISTKLSQKLWNDPSYQYIFVIENVTDLDVDIQEFYKLFNYKEGYKVRSLLVYSDSTRQQEIMATYHLIHRQFDDKYNAVAYEVAQQERVNNLAKTTIKKPKSVARDLVKPLTVKDSDLELQPSSSYEPAIGGVPGADMEEITTNTSSDLDLDQIANQLSATKLTSENEEPSMASVVDNEPTIEDNDATAVACDFPLPDSDADWQFQVPHTDIQKVLNKKAHKILAKSKKMVKGANTNQRLQKIIRQFLTADHQAFQCALCECIYPMDLIQLTYIKPFILCNKQELIDFKNNIIALCNFGCEALFTQGYILVNAQGLTYANTNLATIDMSWLNNHHKELVNKKVKLFNTFNEDYFRAHEEAFTALQPNHE